MTDGKYETRDMSGTLFRETEKTKETQPDYTGKVVVRGETLRIAGWLKEGKSGKPYVSLAFSEPRKPEPQKSKVEVPDDIPF